MSRVYSGGPDYDVQATLGLSARPCSVSCWFYPNDTATQQRLVSLENSGDANKFFALIFRGDSSDKLQARVRQDAGAATSATSTGAVQSSQWNHCGAVWTSPSGAAVYLNGAVDSAVAAQAPTGLDRAVYGYALGAASSPLTGSIAEVAIWAAALTKLEMLCLARGAGPLRIQPGSLVHYRRMLCTEDVDLIGATSLSTTGSVTSGANPSGIERDPSPWRAGERIRWSADAAGTALVDLGRLAGQLDAVITTPGIPAPTANYDVTLEADDGSDALQGSGLNRSATLAQRAFPFVAETDSAAQRPALSGHYRLRIANAGPGAAGTARLIIIDQ